MTDFKQFGLKSEILDSLDEMNFLNPTEVQAKAIPLALDGNDLIVRSKTGTGKTGAFLIPILEKTSPQEKFSTLIILPTRELAIQVFNVSKSMTSHGKNTSEIVYGGASIENQIRALQKRPNIVIGTPGRIIDLMKRGALQLSGLKFLVLDEADIMLDLGFIEDIEYIISKTPKNKQSMLFSATMPERIQALSRKFMKSPKTLKVGVEDEMTVSTISHSYAISTESRKLPALLAYINEYNPEKSIIFAETKRGADYLYNVLIDQGYNVTVMHGDLSQAQREKSLSEFRERTRFLIATNVAARGLDITDVSDVINFDMPNEPYVYVHRVGRSARMGKNGSAFTIVDEDEVDQIRHIERSVNIRMMRIELNQEPYANIGRNIGFHRERHSDGNRPPRRNGGQGGNFRGDRRRSNDRQRNRWH